MRRSSILAAVVLGFVLMPGYVAHAITGNDWFRLSEAEKTAYAAGVADAWEFALVWLAGDAFKAGQSSLLLGSAPLAADGGLVHFLRRMTICFGPKGMQYTQITAIIDKYVRERPARWHEYMPILIREALADACKE